MEFQKKTFPTIDNLTFKIIWCQDFKDMQKIEIPRYLFEDIPKQKNQVITISENWEYVESVSNKIR